MNNCLIFIASVMAAQIMVVRGQNMLEAMMYANMLGQGSSGAGGASGMQNMAALSSLFGQQRGTTGGSTSTPTGLGALAALGGGAGTGQQAAGGSNSQLMRMLSAQSAQGQANRGGAGMGSMLPLATGMSLDTMMEFNMCRHMFGRSRMNPMMVMMYCNSRAA